MAQEFALSSSTSSDLIDNHAGAGHGELAPNQIALGVVIGRTSEFFDFFVYAIASALVFPELFFPNLSRLNGTLASFAIFALAFIARPIGTVLFTKVDRVYGRGVKLTIALFLLGGSTAAISFLPGFASLGAIAVWLLAICRIGQGFGAAGSWDGLASLLAVNAPENRRSWYAMIPQLGAPMGFLLASGLFLYFLTTLTMTDFLAWGWRYPFFVAFAVNVVALFARLRMVETEEYTELFKQVDLKPASVLTLLRREGRYVVIGAFAPLATFAMFHIVTVFPLSWVNLFMHENATGFLRTEMIGACIGFLAIMASGVIADRIGRRKHVAFCALLIAAFAVCAPELLNGGPVGQTIFLLAGFAIMGLSFGQSRGAVNSNFSREFRYTGAAITLDLSWLFGAGFAPLAALGLASAFGLPAVGAYLISAAAVTLIALGVNRWLGS